MRDLPYINLFDEQKTTPDPRGLVGLHTEPEAFDKAITWFGYYTVDSAPADEVDGRAFG